MGRGTTEALRLSKGKPLSPYSAYLPGLMQAALLPTGKLRLWVWPAFHMLPLPHPPMGLWEFQRLRWEGRSWNFPATSAGQDCQGM